LYTSYASETTGFDTREASEHAMQDLGQTLHRLGFGREHIKRQWNYIERITHCAANGQHYQNFNNSRAAFFDQTPWPKGYPAATGIGTSYGGLVIDTLAVKGVAQERALDNPLQQAAHGYSEQVLVGHTQKQTPKFERAKCICDAASGMLYISGTAAIRGEASLAQADVIEQTQITLENIKALLEHTNLPNDLDGHRPKMTCEVARVYLKNPSDWSVVKPLCHAFFGDRIIPLHADVCRSSLLIEIEATYSFIKNLKHEKNPVSLTGAGLELRPANR
jgi:enamine deaminase RidA (YjgF/YER057c/UK114 family)